jgi:hypothetical protein
VISTRRAQGLVRAAMVCRVRAESSRELVLDLVPTLREIPVFIAVRRVRNMVILAYVHGFRIVFAIVPVVAQWFHAYLGALVNHNLTVVTTRF